MTTDKRPLKVFLCYAHIIPLWDSDGTAVRTLDGRDVGGGFRHLHLQQVQVYGLQPTQLPPPYRDHTRLTTLA